MNAQLPMDPDRLRDTLEEALAHAIYQDGAILRSMKRKSKARTEIEIRLARYKQALRAIGGELPVREAHDPRRVRPGTRCPDDLQNQVESALHRRYCSRQLQSEHDFLSGASAACIAIFGQDHGRAVDAVPPDWQELAMCGGSRLAKISDGAD